MNEKIDIACSSDALKLLREVGKALTSTVELDAVLRAIMEMIARLFEPKDWSLLMVDEDKNELYFAIVVGAAADKLRHMRLNVGEGIAGWVAQNGEPVIITDAYHDERFAQWVDQSSGFKTDSMLCVPMMCKGRTLGVIEMINFNAQILTPEHQELLEALADFAAIAIENARFFQRIKELTIVDDCTGLYNSRHMHTLLATEIARSARYKHPFSVIFLDLDHFKQVNDTHGHLIGSRLLREIGQLLRGKLRTVDSAFRYGGDEFVIILPRTTKKEALVVANRLRQALNEAVFFVAEGLNIRITASFGLASYPEDAESKEDMLRRSDQAMYVVKESTRDGICAAEQETIKPSGGGGNGS
jgi:diguanylate cyclase (GGDEF)-like protein